MNAQSDRVVLAAAEARGASTVARLAEAHQLYAAETAVLAEDRYADALTGLTAVRAAFDEVMGAARAFKADARIDGVLVSRMAPKGVELMLGMTRDPVFGPVLVAVADPPIAEAIRAAGGEAVLTRPDHPTGSDRILEAVERFDPDRRHDAVVGLAVDGDRAGGHGAIGSRRNSV